MARSRIEVVPIKAAEQKLPALFIYYFCSYRPVLKFHSAVG